MKTMMNVHLLKSFSILVMLMLASGVATLSYGQQHTKKHKKAIEQVIGQYVNSGDANDAQQLANVLHSEFRVTFNDTSDGTVKIVDRSTYLDMIEKKVWGGDKRQIDIELLDVNGGLTAEARVTMKGSKATFHNYLALVHHQGAWKVVQDLVYVE